MAYHYTYNPDTAEKRTIRTESLRSYEGAGWAIFDTEAERDAYMPPQFWMANYTDRMVRKITAQYARQYWTREYLTAGYSVWQSEADARAALIALPALYAIDPRTGSVVQRRPWLPADHDAQPGPNFVGAYPSTQAAKAAHPPTHYAWNFENGVGQTCYESAIDDLGRGWTYGATQAEAQAKAPYRYMWNGVRYELRRTGTLCTSPSRFAQVRAMIHNARRGENYFRLGRRDFNVTEQAQALATIILERSARRPSNCSIGTQWRNAPAFMVETIDRINSANRQEDGDELALCVCDDCGERICIANNQTNPDGASICGSCADAYMRCRECRGAFHGDDGNTSDDGNWYCDEHWTPTGTAQLGTMLSYSTDVTRSRKTFLTVPGDKKPLWLGWELECHHTEDHEESATVRKVQETAGVWSIVKDDGSLSDGGMEIVSVPASLGWHREHVAPWLGQMAGWIEGWNHTDCGIHVHVGKEELSELTQGKLVAWMHEAENQAFITHVAGRGVGNYCQRGGRKKKIPDYRREAAIGRYQGLNFATRNNATVEFRIFRSNVSPAGFMKNLDFVHALCSWARDASMLEVISNPEGIRGGRVGVMAHKAFVLYVLRNRSTYPALVRWFEQHAYLPKPKAHIDYVPKQQEAEAA